MSEPKKAVVILLDCIAAMVILVDLFELTRIGLAGFQPKSHTPVFILILFGIWGVAWLFGRILKLTGSLRSWTNGKG